MPTNRSLRARLPRFVLLLTAVAVSFCIQAATGLAATPHKLARSSQRAAASKKAHTAGALPAQGIFDSCNLDSSLSTCEQHLSQMHEAGMQVAVVSLSSDSLDEISSYASYAQSIGMSVMWEINDPGFWGGAWIGSSAAADWPGFSTACGCTDTTQVLDYMIQWLSALPATYGYYAADDWTLTAGQVGGLKQYVSEIKSADPGHMVMVGSTQAQGDTYYATGATIGNEIYPETTASLMPYGNNLAAWQSVQQSVAEDQRTATREGAASAFILQAFTFGDSLDDGEAVGVCTPSMSQSQCAGRLQYPSASVQLELRNQVMEHAHPKLILWYTFAQATQGDHWSGLTGVVNAPYPVSATAARAKHSRKLARKHRRHRRHRPTRRHSLSA